MSKNINVNPDHYKGAGRERQGENVIHQLEKREVARLRREETAPPRKARAPDAPIPSRRRTTRGQQKEPGISNRQSARIEAQDRGEHPRVDTSSPPPEDAAGRKGEQPLEDRRDRHTSHKAGSRSIAQKEAGARYPDRSMPPTRKVAGAFGREPGARSARRAAKPAKKRTKNR